MTDVRAPNPPTGSASRALGALLLACAWKAEALAVQETPGPPEAPPATQDTWHTMDGLAATVDGRAITWSAIDRGVGKLRARMNGPAQPDLAETQQYVEGALLRELLMAQMGENMGFQDVAARAQLTLETETEEIGVARMAEFIAAEGFDPQALEEERREQIYSILARRSLTGRDAGARGRPWRDRFVPPGELAAIYERNKQGLGAPPDVTLQVLEIDSRAAGGLAAALDLAERVRAEATAGRDFGELVEEYGFGPSAVDRGILAAVRADQLADPALRAWVMGAAPGDLSVPLPSAPSAPDAAPTGYRVFRLVARSGGAPPPPFEDRGLQDYLREEIVAQRETRWLDRAARTEISGSWRWPETLR